MKKIPKFLREFGRKEGQNTVQEFREEMRDVREQKEQIEQQERKSVEQENLLLVEIQDLEKRIAKIEQSFLSEYLQFTQLQAARSELFLKLGTLAEVKKERRLREEALALREESEDWDMRQIVESRLTLLQEKLEKEWSEAPFTEETKEKYLSPEYLSTLPMEEYVALMRRFPGQMVTHVTRQGLRDHTGHSFHSAGMSEFLHGFEAILENKRLQSALGIFAKEEEKYEALKAFLHLDSNTTKEEALRTLESLRANGGAGSYFDRRAFHMAAEEVADDFYGSERGNEIFFAVPSIIIASQYRSAGKNLSDSQGGMWNDVWIFDKDKEGLPIDAGITFLPKQAQVDAKTGSRYFTNEQGKPLKNESAYDLLKRLVDQDDFLAKAKLAYQQYKQSLSPYRVSDLNETRAYKEFEKEAEERTEGNLSLKNAVLAWFEKIAWQKGELFYKEDFDYEDRLQVEIEQVLQEAGAEFLLAQETISSQEYWEAYFAAAPEKRPLKIVYYTEDSPTEALRAWKKQSGFKNVGRGSRHLAPQTDIQDIREESKAFLALAEEAVEQFFAEQERMKDVDEMVL